MPSPRSRSGAEQFEHAAGAGAEVEQRAERPVGERGADFRLHGLVGDVQLADAVPFGRVRLEIGLRGGRARGADLAEPLAVARDDWVVGIEARDQGADRERRRSLLGEAEERPGAFAEARHQSGLGQELEMARDARLRLTQDFGQVRDGQFGFEQQRQDAQPRLLAGRLEGGVEVVEGDLVVTRHGWTFSSEWQQALETWHIKISLYY